MKFEKRPIVFVDIEINPNAFLIGFMNEKGEPKQFGIYANETIPSLSATDIKAIRKIMMTKTLVGFNSLRYDMPMIYNALEGANITSLYGMSQDIISNNKPDWLTIRDYALDVPRYVDHIDLQDVAEGVFVSLKLYGTRLGSQKLQDLPYAFDKDLSPTQFEEIIKYNVNDLIVTQNLYDKIKPRIGLRYNMSDEYNVDLRSKSDAQIAETVLVTSLQRLGIKATKPTVPKEVSYVAPDVINFKNKQLQDLVERIEDEPFLINPKNGQPVMPTWLKKEKIIIGDTTYNVGLGGLHSQEKKLVVIPKADEVLKNADVASYYPSMIMCFGFYPKHLTNKFLDVYGKIKKVRLEAKASGDKVVNAGLKIVLNGSFGKLGSMYSKLYSPDLMLQVTITGQLMLLMLIDDLERAGMSVKSSNTDGVEYICKASQELEAESIIFDWELATGMDMEHGTYRALYARDVNNYVAVYSDHVKAKGVYTEPTLSKNSEYPIVFKAIRRYLFDNTVLLEDTIGECNDITQFLTSRTVRGGGEWKGEYLGKVVRWYYGHGGESIHYVTNGNKVPKSDGAIPMMDLTESIPDNLDHYKYTELAIKHLADFGVDYVRKM